MNYKLVSISTNQNGIDAVTGRLYNIGIEGVEIKDSDVNQDVLINTCIEVNSELENILKDIDNTISQLKDYDKEQLFGDLNITLQDTCDEDFMNNWKKYYKPTKIGDRIVVVPEWENYVAKDNEIIIKMEPQSAFGSGTHETTSLCIELIDSFCKSYKKPIENLDVGTGTGILALTALKLGAQSSTGIDIDKEAVETAILNANLNDVASKFTGICGNLAEKITKQFNLITANIVADAIIALGSSVGKLLSNDGIFIASGIISEREDDVITNLKQNGLIVIDRKQKNDWVALSLKKI